MRAQLALRKLKPATLIRELVGWCFEPSQPHEVISGLTLMNDVKIPNTVCSVTVSE